MKPTFDRTCARFKLRGALLTMGLGSAVILSSCASKSQNPLFAGPQELKVSMDEYRFDYEPKISAGRLIVRVANSGSVPHRLTLVPLTDDLPPIDAQLRGAERRAIAPFAGAPIMNPGTTGAFAVDMAPNKRYAFVCFLQDLDGQSHALEGMSSEFRTGESTTIGR